MKIYTILDKKAKFYSTPWYSVNNDTAIREFVRTVSKGEGHAHHFPDDFVLYQIGEFDDSTGVITSCAIELLMLGNDVEA